jgi:uncharacterized protein (TIGR03435 family)
MTQRLAAKLGFGNKLRVAAAAGSLLFGLISTPPIRAQSTPTTGASLPSFEVASIKPNKVGHYSWKNRPDGLSWTATNVGVLIFDAYGPRLPQQIAGWPAWSESAKFDIEARMDEETAAALQKLQPKEQAEQRQLMVRSLLADRFGLKVHHEIRMLPIYELVVAKGGPKMKESHATETNTNGIGRLTAHGMPTADLTLLLTLSVNRMVIDKTGLPGQYDFELKWTPDSWGPAAEEFSWMLPESVSGPSIFTAIQEQLGLKLKPTKGPVDVLLIDHIERPSEN